MTTETTVTNPTPRRYTDQSYPGNQLTAYRPNGLIGATYSGTYYMISYTGCARQHERYTNLKLAVYDAIEHVLTIANNIEPLSSDIRKLKDWFYSAQGFVCQHMPWRVLLDGELYTPLVYVLIKHDTKESRAAYHSIRRYGKWV